jgi:hypothetical protein
MSCTPVTRRGNSRGGGAWGGARTRGGALQAHSTCGQAAVPPHPGRLLALGGWQAAALLMARDAAPGPGCVAGVLWAGSLAGRRRPCWAAPTSVHSLSSTPCRHQGCAACTNVSSAPIMQVSLTTSLRLRSSSLLARLPGGSGLGRALTSRTVLRSGYCSNKMQHSSTHSGGGSAKPCGQHGGGRAAG